MKSDITDTLILLLEAEHVTPGIRALRAAVYWKSSTMPASLLIRYISNGHYQDPFYLWTRPWDTGTPSFGVAIHFQPEWRNSMFSSRQSCPQIGGSGFHPSYFTVGCTMPLCMLEVTKSSAKRRKAIWKFSNQTLSSPQMYLEILSMTITNTIKDKGQP